MMTISIRRGALIAACAAAMLGAPAAAAQDAPPRTDEAPPVTPQRLAALAPRSLKSEAPIDWAMVRDTLRETNVRDQIFERQANASAATGAQLSERPGGLRAFAPGQLQRVDPRDVARARLPLLIPLTSQTIGTVRLAVRPDAYTAIADLPAGAMMELLGTRLRVVGGGDDGMRRLRSTLRKRATGELPGLRAPFIISRHEEGVDLSFAKFGASYLISISCPDPDGDERCSQDAYIRAVAENLGILNETAGDGQ